MNIIFAGTPDFSVSALQALLKTEHNIIAVFTQPDRPSGRGQQLSFSPVKQLAAEQNIPVFQPLNFKTKQDQQSLIELNADMMIVVAYGIILKKSYLMHLNTAVLIFMPHYYLAGAVLPPFKEPFLLETKKAVSRLCKWMRGWILAICF